jgi:uncharacterized membrane protein YagU involved in acid resistance
MTNTTIPSPTPRFPYALMVGFYAGLIWGTLRIFSYTLGFTQVVPGFLVEPFFLHHFLLGYGGIGLELISFTLLSFVASILYMILFSRKIGPWPGILYGIVWFVGLYLVVGPFAGLLPPLGIIAWNSLWSDGCIFLLWGVFIGYSISFEFTDERAHKKRKSLLNLQ